MPVTLLTAGNTKDEQDKVLALKGVQNSTKKRKRKLTATVIMVSAKSEHKIGAEEWLIRVC